MSERAFAWRGLALTGRAAAVLGGLLAAAIGSPALAQVVGDSCASPSATIRANVIPFETATPSATAICSGGRWKLLPQLISNTTLPCESATTGLLRYSGGLQVCTGAAWTTLGAAGALALDDLSDALTAGSSIYIGTGVGSTAANNDNTGIGSSSMQSMTSGAIENAAYGKASLATLTTGDANAAFGASALAIVNTGSYNTGVGQNAGQRINGTYNTLLGTGAGRGATNAVITGTTAVGFNAGVALTSSTGNILVGYQAGDAITSGNYNIVIGYDVDPFSNTGSNQLNIGNTIYGDLANKRIGIGLTSPSYPLDVYGPSTGGSSVLLNLYRDGSSGHSLTRYANQMGAMMAGLSGDGNFAVGNDINLNGSNAGLTVVSSTLRIGIGTTTPGSPLHIYMTPGTGPETSYTNPQYYALQIHSDNLSNDNGNGGGIAFGWGGIVGAAITSEDEGTNGATGLAFRTGNGGGNAEAMRIRNTGNVGIGTSNPGFPLEVSGGVVTSIKIGSDNPVFLQSNNPAIGFNTYFSSGSFRWATTSAYAGTISMNPSTGNMFFSTTSVSGTAGGTLSGTGTHLAITRTGNVGIATTAPSGTLHINGTVYMTRNSSAPATCNSTVNGLLALTSAAKMCVCDGTSWKDVGSNYGACTW